MLALNKFARRAGIPVLAAIGLASMPAQAALVAYDGTNITWDVAALGGPLTTALIAGTVGSVVLFVIALGVRFIFRAFSKGK